MYLIIWLSQDWLFDDDVNSWTRPDDSQIVMENGLIEPGKRFKFLRWLWIEFSLLFASITGCTVFLLMSMCSQPQVSIQTAP